MTQRKNSEPDMDMESINHQIEMIDDSRNILNLGGSIFSDMLDERKIEFSKIKTKNNLELCEHLDRLSIEDSWKEEICNLNEEYDIIILDNLLNTTKHPGILLKNTSSMLSKNGSIIASVRNNRHFLNTWKTLGGIFSQIPNEDNYYEFNIDSLFSFLSNLHLTVSKLIRIEEKNQPNLELNTQTSFSPTLLEILKKDPESDVFSYVIEIKKKRSDDQKTREWVTEFPKNYFLESLKSEIEKNENSVELFKKRAKIIEEEILRDDSIDLKEVIEKLNTDETIISQFESQDEEIQVLEEEVADIRNKTQNVLESKRQIKNIFENFSGSDIISKIPIGDIDQTTLGLQAMLVEYTNLRNELKSSKAYNLMKKLDKLRGK